MKKKLSRKNWYTVAAVWLFFGCLYSLQSYHYRVTIGRVGDWNSILINDMGYFLLWGIFSIPIIRWILFWPVQRSNWTVQIPVYLIVGIGVGFLQKGIYDAVFMFQFTESFDLMRWYRSVIGSFELGVFIYLALVFVIHAWMYYRDYQDEKIRSTTLQMQLTQSQLQALQRQLHPHFLFNTLNTVSGLVESDPAAAKLTLAQLGDMLRQMLESDQDAETSLSKEMALTDMYLSIQQTRFGDRLRIVREIDETAIASKVPPMILLPIIENAVEHGIARIPGVNTLRLAITKTGNKLIMTVENHAQSPSAKITERGFGIGLTNTRARLMQMYGQEATLDISVEDNGAVVCIAIPLKKEI